MRRASQRSLMRVGLKGCKSLEEGQRKSGIYFWVTFVPRMNRRHPAELLSAQVSEPSPTFPQSRPHFTNHPGLRRQQYGADPSPWSKFEKVTEASGR